MTGPGRPNRDDQESLVSMAAKAMGWGYTRLLEELVSAAKPLSRLRMRRRLEMGSSIRQRSGEA